MGLPRVVTAAAAKLDPAARKSFHRDYARRRKSLAVAYLAWLLLGWHYLYLGRIGLQLAFWLTAGGFVVWWLIDLFRLPGVVGRHNEDLARELVAQYRAMA
jgi:TM2 domain